MRRLKGKTLFVTAESECWKITEKGSENVAELTSNQEEADTRLLLHAKHAAQEGYEAVAVMSEDKDVFVLLLNFSSIINTRLYLKCSSRTRTRHQRSSSENQARDMRGTDWLHSFTGCDSVSAFAGKGKIGVLKILKGNEGARRAFREVGQSWTVSEDLYTSLEKFTCSMYIPVGNTTSHVNDARYELFCAKNGELESHQLLFLDRNLHQLAQLNVKCKVEPLR